MSNRETFPSSLFPLRGDLKAEAGATTVKVIAIQGIPVAVTVPTDTELLRYISANGDWEPSPDACTVILVNDVPASDDPVIYVNGLFVKVNAVQVLP